MPWEDAQDGDRLLDVRVALDAALRDWSPRGHEIETNGVVESVDQFLARLGPAVPLRACPRQGDLVEVVE